MIVDNSPLVRVLPTGQLQCLACQHKCVIEKGKLGRCRVRGNEKGKLILPVYGRYSIAIDPIEKKPLYHFLPGSKAYSYGTVGCNFSCQFCQNSSLSMWKLDLEDICKIKESDVGRLHKVSPKDVVQQALNNHCECIASTYNEPTVSSEFSFEVFKLAKSKGLRTVYVTNGFESVETLNYLAPYLDAVNIDLKGWSESFYHSICGGTRAGVCQTIRNCYNLGIHTEVTTLVIPKTNDSDEELTNIAQFLASVDPQIVWHVSAYHDDYKFDGLGRTPTSTLQRAAEIGHRCGLLYVYMGNCNHPDARVTFCPKCHTELIRRSWGAPAIINLNKGCCPKCGTSISGLFTDANHIQHPLFSQIVEVPQNSEVTQNSIASSDDGKVVIYATKGGKSKIIGEKIAEKFNVKAIDIKEIKFDVICQKESIIFVVSTYGRGGPPESALPLLNEMSLYEKEKKTPLKGLKFAVCGCGSSGFLKTFCGFAKSFEKQLIELGGTEIVPLKTLDDYENDEEALKWSNTFKL